MHRFFLTPELIQNKMVTFPPEIARQVIKVLRLEAGRQVQVLDGLGQEYLVELTDVRPDLVAGRILETCSALGEPLTRIHLYVALTQREKFEWILQKCTEVGVAEFTPMTTTRSLLQKPSEVAGRFPRWQSILREAAEQSHRGVVPTLHPAISFRTLIDGGLKPNRLGLFLWEEETKVDLKTQLKNSRCREILIVIGPEGGFTADEAQMAKDAGYQVVSLGKRILRMETAAIAAAAQVLYELE